LIGRSEFPKLLRYLVYFNNLWHKFDEIDVDGDHRIGQSPAPAIVGSIKRRNALWTHCDRLLVTTDLKEFGRGCAVIGLKLSEEEARVEFSSCDTDGGGMILFAEFCTWSAKRDAQEQEACEQQRPPAAVVLPRVAVPEEPVAAPAQKHGGDSPAPAPAGSQAQAQADAIALLRKAAAAGDARAIAVLDAMGGRAQ
jgi:hypothetical protein